MSETFLLSQTGMLWMAAVLALLFLLNSSRVADMLAERGGEIASWIFKGVAMSVLVLLAFLPALLVDTPDASANFALMFYILFFSGFCYYVGRRRGWTSGRKHLGEMLGMESPEHMEDTQDRLFESRMRFPSRADVVKSIARLADNPNVAAPFAGKVRLEEDGSDSAANADPELAEIEAYFDTNKSKRQ